MYLRQSTASQEIKLGPFVDDTDGKTPETGLTIANTDIKITKGGSTSEVNKNSGGATHVASGRYSAVLDATDTDTVGILEIDVHVSGALPVRRQFYVLEEAVFDAIMAASAAGYQVPIWSSASATVNLLGTTISSSQAVASVSGSVGSVAGNVSGNINGNVSGSVGSVVGNVGGNVTGSVGSIAANGITAASIASAAITAAKFGSGAIDAAALATDAVAEIADGVWDEAISGHLAAGSTGNALNAAGSAGDPWSTTLPGGYTGSQAGKMLSDILVDTGTTLQAELDGIQADTEDIQSRLPSALVGGRIDATIDGTGMEAGATAAIADAVWDELIGDHTAPGSTGAVLGDGAADAGTADASIQILLNDWQNGGRLDLLLDAVKAKTDNLPSDPADASDIASSFSTVNTKLDAIDDFVDTEMAAIKAVTDKLDTAMVLDGSVWQFTVNALELAPAGGGGGSTDWNADERTAIRAILGIPGSGTTPADPSTGILDTIRDLVVTVDNVADGIATQVGTAGAGLTAVPWNAAWDAEVQSECADALTAYDPPTNAEMEARTLVAANYGTAANQTTILARLGSWTGSGINTILGAFRALAAKASALTPTDISTGTTFDNTTDSLEAVVDRGNVAWITGAGGGGSSQAVIGSTNAITRNINETLPIQFTWNSASATITGTVELGTASAVALQGSVSFVRTDAGGKHWYQLAYDSDDRPAVAGLARYVFTDGTDYLTVPVQFTEVASGGSSGTGARTITVTVNDGSNPIQNALVRLTLGAETFISTTNVSGQCTLNVDDGTWSVGITAAGFSFAGATLVVDGNETVTYSMAAVSPPFAASPGLCTVRFTFYENDGTTPIQNVIVSATLDQNVAVANSILSNAIQYGTSNALGIVDLVLVQGASIKRGNKAYKIQASDPQSSSSLPLLDFRTVIPTVSTINASSLVPLEGRR